MIEEEKSFMPAWKRWRKMNKRRKIVKTGLWFALVMTLGYFAEMFIFKSNADFEKFSGTQLFVRIGGKVFIYILGGFGFGWWMWRSKAETKKINHK